MRKHYEGGQTTNGFVVIILFDQTNKIINKSRYEHYK